MTELLPCPFCGGSEIKISHCNFPPNFENAQYQAMCTHCGARSEWHYTKDFLIEKWNTRTPLPEKSQPDTFAHTDPSTHWRE